MNKSAVRKSFLQQRLELSDAEYENRNDAIRRLFFANIDLSSVDTLHTFLPMRDRREPDTLRILKELQQKFPAIKIAVPRVNSATNALDHFYIGDDVALHKSKWGIDEPSTGEAIDMQSIDMVIVPLLAFDLDGHRVGYGKGFYDKFLGNCNLHCRKVGLSLFSPVTEKLDAEPHDIRLDVAITPDTFYTF